MLNYYQSLFSNGAMKEVFWAGAQRQGGSDQIDGMDWAFRVFTFLLLFKKMMKTLKQTDGSDFTFMRWDVGEPSFEWNGHAEDCLSVKGSGTRINLVFLDCDLSGYFLGLSLISYQVIGTTIIVIRTTMGIFVR